MGLSFAGSGPNTRDTSLFIATAQDPRQLAAFGTQAWERAVGIVTRGAGGNGALGNWYTGYGDMAELPGGKGPSHERVVKEGSAYTKKDFPELDYLKKCKVVIPDDRDVNQLEAAWPAVPIDSSNWDAVPEQTQDEQGKSPVPDGQIKAYFFNTGKDELQMFFEIPGDGDEQP